MLLQKIKNILGIDNQDEVIVDIIDLVNGKILTYLNLNEVPIQLEWIVVEMSIARFNRIGSEGVTTESVDGKQTTYENELAPYIMYLDDYIKKNVKNNTYRLL